jgi:hypothetical protein
MVVIADSAPIDYLVLIGESELLPVLYGSVAIPTAVLTELRSRGAPSQVREWASNPPPWLCVEKVDPAFLAHTTPDLDAGEREAIALARQLQAELLVIIASVPVKAIPQIAHQSRKNPANRASLLRNSVSDIRAPCRRPSVRAHLCYPGGTFVVSWNHADDT